MKYRQEPRAVVTTCGEGGTSKGDYYEAHERLLRHGTTTRSFVVNNNQWANLTPTRSTDFV